jgi:hypothetical protein
MTPEQAAAYINAQSALMLVELERLKAHYQQLAVDENQNVIAVWHAIPVTEIGALQERYDPVLGENAISALFQRVNGNSVYRGPG